MVVVKRRFHHANKASQIKIVAYVLIIATWLATIGQSTASYSLVADVILPAIYTSTSTPIAAITTLCKLMEFFFDWL